MNSREQFEQTFPVPSNIRWSEEHQSYGFIRRKGNDISQVHRYRSMWNAWQASRETLLVELPARMNENTQSYERDLANMAFNEAVDDCREAIETAGLKVKP